MRYTIIGLLSGLISCTLPLVFHGGSLLPGLVFGVALLMIDPNRQVPLVSWRSIGFVALSTAAFIVAGFASLAMTTVVSDREPVGIAIAGTVAGLMGGVLLALSYQLLIYDDVLMRPLAIVGVVSALSGALFTSIGVFLSDHPSVGHPIDDFVVFPIWQGAVAYACGRFLFRRDSPYGLAT